MKRFSLFLALALLPFTAQAKVHTLQVTIGASATQIVSGDVYFKWVVFQNNSADNQRIGDANVSSTQGTLLVPGSSFYTAAPSSPGSGNLNGWYVSGTQNDKIDITYDDGQ